MPKLLYQVFEEHLFRVDATHDVSTDVFVDKVVQDFIGQVSREGFHIPWKMKTDMTEDLRDEVVDMIRKKTYGYNTLADYRRAKKTRGF